MADVTASALSPPVEEAGHRMCLEKIFRPEKLDGLKQSAREHGARLALVGSSVIDIYLNYHPGPSHITLLTLDWSGDFRLSYGLDKIRSCLRDHDYDSETCEATLRDSDITVNLWEWIRDDEATIKKSVVGRLLKNTRGWYSTCVLYLDKFALESDRLWWSVRTYYLFTPPKWDEQSFRLRLLKPPSLDNPERRWVEWTFLEWRGGARSVDGGQDDSMSPPLGVCKEFDLGP